MTEEEILLNEVKFAEYGRQVLDNPAYQEAMKIRKAQIFEVFCGTKAEQSDVRDEAWRTMKNILALESYFQQLMETGNMAKSSLKSMKKDI